REEVVNPALATRPPGSPSWSAPRATFTPFWSSAYNCGTLRRRNRTKDSPSGTPGRLNPSGWLGSACVPLPHACPLRRRTAPGLHYEFDKPFGKDELTTGIEDLS